MVTPGLLHLLIPQIDLGAESSVVGHLPELRLGFTRLCHQLRFFKLLVSRNTVTPRTVTILGVHDENVHHLDKITVFRVTVIEVDSEKLPRLGVPCYVSFIAANQGFAFAVSGEHLSNTAFQKTLMRMDVCSWYAIIMFEVPWHEDVVLGIGVGFSKLIRMRQRRYLVILRSFKVDLVVGIIALFQHTHVLRTLLLLVVDDLPQHLLLICNSCRSLSFLDDIHHTFTRLMFLAVGQAFGVLALLFSTGQQPSALEPSRVGWCSFGLSSIGSFPSCQIQEPSLLMIVLTGFREQHLQSLGTGRQVVRFRRRIIKVDFRIDTGQSHLIRLRDIRLRRIFLIGSGKDIRNHLDAVRRAEYSPPVSDEMVVSTRLRIDLASQVYASYSPHSEGRRVAACGPLFLTEDEVTQCPKRTREQSPHIRLLREVSLIGRLRSLNPIRPFYLNDLALFITNQVDDVGHHHGVFHRKVPVLGRQSRSE